jgi:hypothetical protein
VRDRETIDSELRLLAAIRRVCHEHGGMLPSVRPVDQLLDECSAHRGRPARTWQSTRTAGPYATPPHTRHVQVVCPPQHMLHGWWPTSIPLGRKR